MVNVVVDGEWVTAVVIFGKLRMQVPRLEIGSIEDCEGPIVFKRAYSAL